MRLSACVWDGISEAKLLAALNEQAASTTILAICRHLIAGTWPSCALPVNA
jgi:hypothetical protein